MIYTFAGRNGKYQIPHGAMVTIIRFYPRRKALVEFEGRKILTMTFLLRR